MSQRTQLLKKAVLTSVGASTSTERIKQALAEVAEDLCKVGKELLGDLEQEGEAKTENWQNLLKNLQSETTKRKSSLEQNFQSSIKKTARDLGFITREDLDEVLERLDALEDTLGDNGDAPEGKKQRVAKSAKRSS
jgi:polyhydroxyalkanoate synthesis regulator phasin